MRSFVVCSIRDDALLEENPLLVWSYVATAVACVAVTFVVCWRRRRSLPDPNADYPALGPYELARLARGRYGQIEVMMATLLDARVLRPGEGWSVRDFNEKTWRLAVCGDVGRAAHELERRFVAALQRSPGQGALMVASDVVGDVGNRLDAPLIAAGLLYDESRTAWGRRKRRDTSRRAARAAATGCRRQEGHLAFQAQRPRCRRRGSCRLGVRIEQH